MPIAAFAFYFDVVAYNVNNKGWGVGYFLKLNDQSEGRHQLVLTSTANQKVWVTAHTWDER